MIPMRDAPYCERCHKCNIERVEYVMNLMKDKQNIPHVHTWDERGECIGVRRSRSGDFELCKEKYKSTTDVSAKILVSAK
jgi:hypothetical protein